MSDSGRDMDRRTFLGRAARAGALTVGAAGLGVLLHDPTGAPRRRRDATLSLPDYRAPGDGPELAVANGADRGDTLARALAMLGGLERFVRPGERVLLKVNAAFATPAPLGATSHPDLVEELARRCLAVGARAVTITDNPINDPRSAFEVSGLADAARRSGASLLVPRPEDFRAVTIEGADLLRAWPILVDPLLTHDRVIGLAPVKHHHRAGASLTMKNWYGLLGGQRNLFHQDINGIVLDLARMLRPTLVVLDGTVSMMRNGPTGGALSDLAPTRTLIVGTDPVAADVLGASLLGVAPADIPYLAMAAAAGVGEADPARVRVVTDGRG
jgi:uncharacterized protein (DUF362 family)